MTQNYNAYTPQDHEVWTLLFKQQETNLVGKACNAFLQGLDHLKPALYAQRLPDFNKLNETFKTQTGWTIEVVAGLIPVEDFFYLLSQKKFPSSTWMRTMEQLDYLEEPDMFHDLFGHIPQLVHQDYSNFMQKFGSIGYQHRDNKELVIQLQRLYWFTIEFGLILEQGKTRIYGAGITSSIKESNHVFSTDITIMPFDIETIMAMDYEISDIQKNYFQINSYQQLYNSLESFS